MKTEMNLLYASNILFVSVYVNNHDSCIGTFEFTLDDLIAAKLFTCKDIYLHCIAIVKESDFIPEYDINSLKVSFINSSTSSEESIKRLLNSARINRWKKDNVSHTMQIKFTGSEEDINLYNKLLEIDNRSEFIKSVLRITLQNHVKCMNSAE